CQEMRGRGKPKPGWRSLARPARRWLCFAATRTALLFPFLVPVYTASSSSAMAGPLESKPMATARQIRIPVGDTELYCREVGRGNPIIVLHGGPDFDHSYLVPEMDRLSDSFRLIYYDQRGRGESAGGVKPEDVTLASDIADLEKVRQYFQLSSVALLGHSWGTVLALEYALRHPQRVSHLLLMNPAPASSEDSKQFRTERRAKLGADLDQLRAVADSTPYKEGDPDAVAAYYRLLFKHGLSKPEHLQTVIARLRASFTKEKILRARAIEDRLMNDSWSSDGSTCSPCSGR